LLVERHRVSATIEARLHQVAIALVAAGRTDDAIPYASRAVALNPLEEGNYELLIRSLATAGDRAAAEHEQQIAVCEDLLRRELGRRVTGSHAGGPQECACPRGARSGRGRRWTTILTTQRGPYWRIWLASRLDAIFANW
jgi:hypothetical protein